MTTQDLYYIAALITAVVGTYLAESIRRRNRADEASTLTEGAMKMVEAKDREINDLKRERTILKLYISYLITGIDSLRQQIKGKNKPVFIAKSLEDFSEN